MRNAAPPCSAISTPPPRQAPLTAATVRYGNARMRPKSSWPARLPSIASSRVAPGNCVTSAPAANTNGFPVRTSASQSPSSSSGSNRSSDSSAARPKNVGLVWSSPLSIVTSATTPASGTSTLASLNSVSGSDVLPDERCAHAHPDAERGQPVADIGPFPEAVGELREQSHAGRGQRVAAGDCAAVRVETHVLGIDAHPVAPAQHLHRERLVQLEQAELVERQPRAFERLLGRRHGPEAHQFRL